MTGAAVASQEALKEACNEIRTLHAECQKKREDLERKERQRRQADHELERWRERLHRLDAELSSLRHTALKAEVEDPRTLVNQARSDFMDAVVGDVLRGRLPVLAAGGAGREDEGAGGETREGKGEEQGKSTLHDTVLVSYANLDGVDHQVAYRIGAQTTIDQLHRDACSYWGCSHSDYVLCKTGAREEAEPLWRQGDPDAPRQRRQRLQIEGDPEHSALESSESAQLHLVKWEDLANFQLARKKLKDQEPKILQEVRDKAQDPNSIKTYKLGGHGFASAEAVMEPHIEALRQWPGLYHLLREHRQKAPREEKWRRVRCRELLALLLLAALTASCYGLRGLHGSLELRNGVAQTLGNGVGLLGAAGSKPMPFNQVALYDDVWLWLDGVLAPELFDERSTLRTYYRPVGYLRLRQQVVRPTVCGDGRVLPPSNTRPCYFVESNAETQDTAARAFAPSPELAAFLQAPAAGGRALKPDPFVWQPADEGSRDVYGYMQHRYDSSGFSIVYNLSASTGARFAADLPFVKEYWVVPQTRMLAVEFSLANYHLGGYVSANFVFEISPGGAVKPNADIKNFVLFRSWQWDVAIAFDVMRWILAVGYFFLFRVYSRTREKASSGKSRFAYITSVSGLFDVVVCGLFIAVQVYTYKGLPPAPESAQGFHSYYAYATDLEITSILEASFLMACALRMALAARMSPKVYISVKVLRRSLPIIIHFSIMLALVLIGLAGLAHAVWSPHLEMFSTYTMAMMSVVTAIYQPFAHVEEMYQFGSGWALPFLIYFVLCVTLFMMHVFLAIVVHSHWEVELLETQRRGRRSWSADQWLDWALWAPVYKRVTGRTPGSSRHHGDAEAEADASSSSGSSSDEER